LSKLSLTGLRNRDIIAKIVELDVWRLEKTIDGP
jgi:hypothetical protein